MSAPRVRGDGGQAAVELALALPLLALLLLALAQVGLIVGQQVLVTHAAREAVRQAAVDSDPGAPARAARESSPLDPERLTVEVHGRGSTGSRVTVQVVYRAETDLPLVGPLVGDVELRARATMRVE